MDPVANGPHLILLTGPVGGGKTTTAGAIANRIRQTGLAAAAIDLDPLYCMARQADGYGDPTTWELTRRSAGRLAAEFLEGGIDVVVIEGGFHSAAECDDVRSQIPTHVSWNLVTLNVSYEETARRVESDPAVDRVDSRNPRILRRLYSGFSNALPFLTSSGLVIEADSLLPEEVANVVVEGSLT
jgi:molybdopterin-guanine dinucleotide biosynthesis protein